MTETLAHLYDRMRLTVRSPDGSVTIEVAGRGGLDVVLRPGSALQHTEASLQRQVDAAVRVAIVAYAKASRAAYVRAVGALPPDPPDDSPVRKGETMHTPMDRLRAALAETPLRARSARGFVAVVRDGGEVRVGYRPGTLARLSDAELAEETRSGLAAALAAYRTQQRHLTRRYLGADVLDGRSDADV